MQRTESRILIAAKVYGSVCKQGGRTAKELATELNVRLQCVSEALLALESDGLLLYEDERGGLYPFTEEK